VDKYEADVDFIPVSARVKFELTSSQYVDENQEFKDLKGRVTDTVKQFHRELKTHIIAKMKLEAVHVASKCANIFCTTLRDVVSLFHLANKVEPELNLPVCLHIINVEGGTLLDKLSIISTQLHEMFLTMFNISAQDSNTTLSLESTPSIISTLHSIFTTSLALYLNRAEDIKLELELKVRSNQVLQTEQTDVVVEMVDTKQPATHETMQAMVTKEANKTVNRQLKNAFNKANSSKNGRRGQTSKPSPGALKMKKKSNTTERKKANNADKGQRTKKNNKKKKQR